MNAFFYDSLGVNDGVFRALYPLHGLFPDAVWGLLACGYGYWMAAVAGCVIGLLYLKDRHMLSPRRSAVLGEMAAVLILAFSLVWCAVYTVQTVTLWPRPWMMFSDTVVLPATALWHEGFPAVAPAIAMMISTLCWPHAGRATKIALSSYVVGGSLIGVVSGQSWPVDVVAGLCIGYAGVRLARAYYYFGIRLVAR